MTERAPGDDTRPQDREEVALSSGTVGLPASAHGQVGSMALQGEPEGPTGSPELVVSSPEDLALTYEAGVEPKARSQWAYARLRFFRHRLAVVSGVIGMYIAWHQRIAPSAAPELTLVNATLAGEAASVRWRLTAGAAETAAIQDQTLKSRAAEFSQVAAPAPEAAKPPPNCSMIAWSSSGTNAAAPTTISNSTANCRSATGPFNSHADQACSDCNVRDARVLPVASATWSTTSLASVLR